jgi:hypothetical protein
LPQPLPSYRLLRLLGKHRRRRRLPVRFPFSRSLWQKSACWRTGATGTFLGFEPLPNRWLPSRSGIGGGNRGVFCGDYAFLLSGQAESLEGFLRDWPGSRWAAALSHNLGLLKYEAGFFTAAKEYWKRSWELARGSKDPRMRALAHQSVAQLARMHARRCRLLLRHRHPIGFLSANSAPSQP